MRSPPTISPVFRPTLSVIDAPGSRSTDSLSEATDSRILSGRANRPKSVVLAGNVNAEDRDERVPGDRIDRASLPLDDVSHPLEKVSRGTAARLRVERAARAIGLVDPADERGHGSACFALEPSRFVRTRLNAELQSDDGHGRRDFWPRSGFRWLLVGDQGTRQPSGRQIERWVVSEDRLLQSFEFLSRVDTKLAIQISRPWWYTASASAWRPDRYSASIN